CVISHQSPSAAPVFSLRLGNLRIPIVMVFYHLTVRMSKCPIHCEHTITLPTVKHNPGMLLPVPYCGHGHWIINNTDPRPNVIEISNQPTTAKRGRKVWNL